jgi:hypothetical protein
LSQPFIFPDAQTGVPISYHIDPGAVRGIARRFPGLSPEGAVDTFRFHHPASGMTFQPTSVHAEGDDDPNYQALHVFGSVLANGQKAGDFHRLFQPDFDTNQPQVNHASLWLAPHVQDQGAASAWLHHLIPQYQKLGVQNVSLHANIDVGSYAWALHGFEPNEPEEREALFGRWQGHLANLVQRRTITPEAFKQGTKLQGVGEIARFDPGPRLPYETRSGKASGHVGKAFLLNEYGMHGPGWHGQLDLTPGSPGLAAGQRYRTAKLNLPYLPETPDLAQKALPTAHAPCRRCADGHGREGLHGPISDLGTHSDVLLDEPSLLL